MGLLSNLLPLKKNPKNKVRRFDANSSKTTHDGWTPVSYNVGARPHEVKDLNLRVEDLIRNDPTASKAMSVLRAEIIGSGVTPHAFSKSGNHKAEKKLEKILVDFFDSVNCDARLENDYYAMQKLLANETFKAGFCFARRRYRSKKEGLPLTLQIELLSSDYLATDYTPSNLAKGRRVKYGIEYDSRNRKRAFYFYKENPRDSFNLTGAYVGSNDVIRVLAKDICHVYDPDHLDEGNGVSWFKNVIPILRMTQNFRLNVLTKQQMQSSITAIAKVGDNSNPNDLFGKEETSESGSVISKITRGQINRLELGEDLIFPNMPDIEKDSEFYQQYKRDIANGVGPGIAYESLSGDFSQTTYSSSRAARLLEHRLLSQVQSSVFGTRFFNKVNTWVLETAYLDGLLSFSEYQDLEILNIFPVKESVDLVKDTKATVEQINAKIKSVPEAIRESGRDYLKTMKLHKLHLDTMNELGLASDPITGDSDNEQKAKKENDD